MQLNGITLIRLKTTSFINDESSTNTVEANDKNYKSNASLKIQVLSLILNTVTVMKKVVTI